MRRLLSERLGLALPRHVLRSVFDSSSGNPLFALELGRALVERGLPETGEDIPVPDAVEDLLGIHVARLPRPTRRLLLAVALSGDPRVSEVEAFADPVAVEDAIEAGVLVLDRDRVRAIAPAARRGGEETLAGKGAAGTPPRARGRSRGRGAAGSSPRPRDATSGCRSLRTRSPRRRQRPRREARFRTRCPWRNMRCA